MDNKMNYGSIVDLEPVAYVDAYIFIPKYFTWEKEGCPAEIVMGDYIIRCNLGTKLLFETDKGLVEMALSFTEKDHYYKLNIFEFFESNYITYRLGKGIYCDGNRYDQNSSSREVIYNKNAIIEKISSPYWGLQMELFIVNKKKRPKVRGRKIKIIRFNYCRKDSQYKIENWFKNVVNGTIKIEPYTLDQVMRENLERIDFTACALFDETDNGYRCESYGELN